jgi:hypothetical protein
MSKKILKTAEPVVLEGFQNIFQISQYGNHQLEAILGDDLVDILENDRLGSLEWAKSKSKKGNNAPVNEEPWKKVAEGKYKARFTWTPDKMPVVVDTEGTPVTDRSLTIMSGSKVKLAFWQKPYAIPAGTVGTKLVLEAIQLISVSDRAGTDAGDIEDMDPAEIFGTTKGYKQSEPNVISDVNNDDAIEDDF